MTFHLGVSSRTVLYMLVDQGRMYLVEEMWWNHLDSTHTLSVIVLINNTGFMLNFNWDNCDNCILHGSCAILQHCELNM